jgi:glycosyltransferase involved in cell wall biosynthesis
MTPTFVTIGITAFNASKSIEKAVYSALNQTWKSIEIVVVDDFSEDNTLNILNKLAKQHRELHFYSSKTNCGVAAARNRIIKEAKGEFLVFFDDDDESDPRRIELQIKRIVEYEQNLTPDIPVLCHSARLVKYPNGEKLIQKAVGEDESLPAPSGVAFARRAILGTPLRNAYGSCPTCSQMARLKSYKDLDGFDNAFRRGEDSDLCIRLAKKGGHLIGIKQPLVYQNMTPSNDKSLADELKYSLMLIEKHKDIADNETQYLFCREWIKIKFFWLNRKWGTFSLGLSQLFFRHPIMVLMRLVFAVGNVKINNSFGRFHEM